MTLDLIGDCGHALSGRITDVGIVVDTCHCAKEKDHLIVQLYTELPTSTQSLYRYDVERTTGEQV